MDNKAQVIYFSHGGGPMPILGDPSHRAMNDFMKELPKRIKKPEAIIVFSAHWEENTVAVQGAENPPMLYDYYGFPEEAYEITYNSKGSPELASRIHELLKNSDIDCIIDKDRGYDHGLFIPLKMMYPNEDIPSIQVSLLHSLSAQEHIKLGEALSALMEENILIIGSGFSFHNLRAFGFLGTDEPDEKNDAFQDWLIETISGNLTWEERKKRLISWESAPNARYCHPRQEHLLPVHVCAGIAGDRAEKIFDDYIAGKRAVAFLWG